MAGRAALPRARRGARRRAGTQEAGHEVVAIDNLVNSSEESLRRVAELSGKAAVCHHVDLVEESSIDAVVAAHPIGAVIHFAGLKAVGESAREPLRITTTTSRAP
jgi:UDP-glucose 4-epimerase